jgi:hypothetical protein
VRFLLPIILIILIPFRRAFAQDVKPMYLSVAYGSDRDLEKSNVILTNHPTLISLTFEKRLTRSEFYGWGIHASRFTSVFGNYNHLSFRGYQHFGNVENAQFGNFDPYIGAFLGVDNYQKTVKPAVGVFVGARLMVTQSAGFHAEFSSISSGFNSSVLLEFGFTTCFLKNDSPKFKKRGNRCPK